MTLQTYLLFFSSFLLYANAQMPCLCQNGGSCLNPNQIPPSCACPKAYTGMFCEMPMNITNNGTIFPPIPKCSAQGCLNNGTCSKFNNIEICICMKGYSGVRCELKVKDKCDFPHACKNGGECKPTGYRNDYRCNCPNGVIGKFCESYINNPCTSDFCQGGGTCRSRRIYDYNSAMVVFKVNCSCPNNRYGNRCENIKPCSSNPCKNDGKCYPTYSKPGFFCKCKNGFEGRDCNIAKPDLCKNNPCLNEGLCYQYFNFTMRQSEMICVCQGSWRGKTCSEDYSNPCENNPCKNGGKCQNSGGGKYFCSCTDEYMGKRCDYKNPCLSEKCNSKGYCVVDWLKSKGNWQPKSKCICRKNYGGEKCDKMNPCLIENPCLNGGDCIAKPIYSRSKSMFNKPTITGFESPMCNCTKYFGGEKCEDLNPCIGNNPCENGICLSNYTYIPFEKKMKKIFNKPICLCPLDFEGEFCHVKIINPCEENPCQNDGKCFVRSDDKSKHVCNCTKKFEGENCDIQKNTWEIASCDFENGCPDFKYYTTNSYYWKTRAGSTPSYRTGPNWAHGGKKYSFTEASRPAVQGNKAHIQTMLMDAGGTSCVSLYYHMYGSGIGTLRVYLMDKSRFIIGKAWEKKGAQGNEWKYMSMEVQATKAHLVVEGIRGNSWSGDIAVDDIIWNSGPCPADNDENSGDQQ